MSSNRRMNGLEHAFEGAPAISLRVFDSPFLQKVVRPSVSPHHKIANNHTPEEDNGHTPGSD